MYKKKKYTPGKISYFPLRPATLISPAHEFTVCSAIQQKLLMTVQKLAVANHSTVKNSLFTKL